MNDVKEFVICGIGRTGSTYLTELLHSHPDIICLPEILDRTFLNLRDKWEEKINNQLATNGEDIKLTESIEDNYFKIKEKMLKQGKVFGFKFLQQNEKYFDEELNVFNYSKHIIHNTSIKKIIILRNMLETYISNKTGSMTKKWAYEDTSKTKIEFDHKEYLDYCFFKQRYYSSLLYSIGETKQTPLIITYNNVVNKECYKQIFNFLNVDENNNLKSKTTKQNSEFLHERVKNYKWMKRILTDTKDKYFLQLLTDD